MSTQSFHQLYSEELTETFQNLDSNQLSHKCVLICGAAGLVGTAFAKLLLESNIQFGFEMEIYVLGRNRAALEGRFSAYADMPGFHILVGDIIDISPSGFKPDFIVQAASPAHPLAYSQMPVDVMRANLMGTANMLELAKSTNARLLFISSGEIYGTSNTCDSAFRENDYGYIEILNPRSCYPESKRAAETLCASYFAQYEVNTAVARLCHVYGPTITTSNSRADAQFLRNAIRHEDIIMKSPGTQIRSFCYVKDAAAGLLYILLKGTLGNAYNIANKNSIATIREYAETLASISGVKIRNEFPPEVEAHGYSQISRAVLDAAKLEGLGWKAQYDLRQGLEDTVNLLKGGIQTLWINAITS